MGRARPLGLSSSRNLPAGICHLGLEIEFQNVLSSNGLAPKCGVQLPNYFLLKKKKATANS